LKCEPFAGRVLAATVPHPIARFKTPIVDDAVSMP
jgi:hypothetical protein